MIFEIYEKVRARVRRGADNHQSSPMKALNLFQVVCLIIIFGPF